MILDNKLRKGETIVLDGATGSEIARLGGAMDSAAWCGVANKTHPEVVGVCVGVRSLGRKTGPPFILGGQKKSWHTVQSLIPN